MTAPALPPEVESHVVAVDALLDAVRKFVKKDTPTGLMRLNDAMVAARDSTAALRTAIARALGGDGEPVAWAVYVKGEIDSIQQSKSDADVIAYDINFPEDGVDDPSRAAVVPLYTRPAATGDTGEGDCPHHSETGLGGCGRFAWHCDGCGRIRWIYDASKGIGSRADVPRGVVLDGPPTTAVEIARRMLTLGDVALLLERAGSSDDEQGSARRTLLRLEALRNALAAEATRAATGGPDAR